MFNGCETGFRRGGSVTCDGLGIHVEGFGKLHNFQCHFDAPVDGYLRGQRSWKKARRWHL